VNVEIVEGINSVGFIMDPTPANRMIVVNGDAYLPDVSGTVPADITTSAGPLEIGGGFEGIVSSAYLMGDNVDEFMLNYHHHLGGVGYVILTVQDEDSISFDDSDIDAYVPEGQVTIVSFSA
jgi:hypothetical protein